MVDVIKMAFFSKPNANAQNLKARIIFLLKSPKEDVTYHL
ncbi:hypothetical protein B488_03420 [Liberibacter crescens BT-1]|uniref:Uncharacterized protein n=1 Tax=Liberibacter crescens (strain BT-1) TaxID=1215343 RepID=L0EU04_LIBCB|nr:hypothetical protein B488_03420 [Liberibacter crescens BT-1]